MKKYCFTDCFKRKMSNGGKIFIEIILTMIGIMLASVAIVSILYGIGWLESLFFNLESNDYIPFGILTVLGMVATTLVSYWTYLLIIFFKRRGTDFIVKKYEESGGYSEDCSIFEECKEEK